MTSRAIIHMAWGPQSFQKAVLEPGEFLTIGPSDSAGFQIINDKQLGTSQVELFWDGSTCMVRALNPGERVLLNGQAVSAGQLGHSEWFRIGDSTFMLCLERQTPPRVAPDSVHEPLWSAALSAMRAAEGSLYAVLDAARDERILELLRESDAEARSLYEGVKGDAMALVAPYLVRLDPQGWLLEALVHEGWGQGWGIYLDCPLSFKEVRRHFRHFLRVQEAGSRDFLYFRFYDPRVLRIFIPTCSVAQLEQFYGPIRRFWVEDSSGAPLQLSNASRLAWHKVPDTSDEDLPAEI